MKKSLLVLVLAVFIFLCACGKPTATSDNTKTTETDRNDSTHTTCSSEVLPSEVETNNFDITKNNLLPLPEETVEFCFLSGASAWRTIMTLNRDGSFIGWYLDSEMGDTGEGYPHGSAFVCDFSGEFTDIEKISDYAYRMTLSDVITEKQPGEEWIEGKIRYVASEPYGIETGSEFILYLPDTSLDEVPEEFLSWWPYRYQRDSEQISTLSCYGILNVLTNYGFFHYQLDVPA